LSVTTQQQEVGGEANVLKQALANLTEVMRLWDERLAWLNTPTGKKRLMSAAERYPRKAKSSGQRRLLLQFVNGV